MKLVIPVGGIGTQADATAFFPTIVEKTVWDAGTPGDFMGANGGYLYSDTSGTLEAQYGGTDLTILGDFSNAVVGMYAWINLVASYSGYFEILSKSATSLVVDVTNLAGEVVNNTYTVDALYIGGAGSSITVADSVIANDIDVDVHSVDVLTNLDEEYTAAQTLSASSGTKGKIRFLGKRHAVGHEFEDCADSSQYPVIEMNANRLTCNMDYVDFECLKVRSSYSSHCWYITGKGSCLVNKCYVHNYSTGTTTRVALALNPGGVVTNSVIISDGTYASDAVLSLSKGSAYNNLIISNGNNRGIGIDGGYATSSCFSNIVIGSGVSSGIRISAAYSVYATGAVSGNIICNFEKGFDLGLGAVNKDRAFSITNNIIWGSGTDDGSYGIYNSEAATYDTTIILNNNFIGNCQYESNISHAINTISLTANPFKNASGNLNVPGDFYLNDAEGGGALIKANYQPTDYDLDGTRDNYQYGPIMKEVTAGGGGGGGGVSASRIFGGL